jgi:Tripartite tricarboxylate transporter TctB family
VTTNPMSEVEKLESDQVTPVVDIAAGLFLAAMAVAALMWLIPNYIVSGAGEYDVGPAFFPKMAAWIVLGLSLSLVALKSFGLKTAVLNSWGRSGKSIVFEIIIWSLIATLALLGIAKTGFLLTASLIIGLGAIVCGYRTWWLIAVLAVAFPLLVNQLVWAVFTVALP